MTQKLTFIEPRDKLIDNILHGPVRPAHTGKYMYIRYSIQTVWACAVILALWLIGVANKSLISTTYECYAQVLIH